MNKGGILLDLNRLIELYNEQENENNEIKSYGTLKEITGYKAALIRCGFKVIINFDPDYKFIKGVEVK